jgi:cell wall-associated NlpC family hydrolase
VSAAFDRRVTPARSDIAAASLKGQVAAERFVEGRMRIVARGLASLRKEPSEEAGLETQLLFGEGFTVYEEKQGWVWGQAVGDSYVGYARTEAFAAPQAEHAHGAPSHRVIARQTPLLSAPDVKKPARDLLPMNARLAVVAEGLRFLRLTNRLYVFAGHAAALDRVAPDWVAVAEDFQGVPYLWGGKSAAGLDCSGLIQTALEAGGRKAPRDTDMMEEALGIAVAPDGTPRRGDLLFWKGHMGVMLDGARLLHANAFFMQVTAEPLAAARARILEREGLAIRAIRRLD